MDASFIIYTGTPLPNTPIPTNTSLPDILAAIDAAILMNSSAPDYSGFNLGCLRSSYTINTTQQFAEAVANYVCTLSGTVGTFINTTYSSDQTIITSAISAIQAPSLTYNPIVADANPFGVAPSDSLQVFYSKLFTGLDAMIAQSKTGSANWGSLSVGPFYTLVDSLNFFITALLSIGTSMESFQTSLGTFNNSDCLGGGLTDTPIHTINLIKGYVCTLPTYNASPISWGCVAQATNLQDSINNICTSISYTMTNYVNTNGLGLLMHANGACVGQTLSIDETWPKLFKVATTSTAANLGQYDYLANVVTSLDSTVVIDHITTPGKLDLSVPNTALGHVLVNNSDPTPGTLVNKLPAVVGDWGLAIVPTATPDNTQLALKPTIVNPAMFIQNFVATVAEDPELLALWCTLQPLCAGYLCTAPTNLLVTLSEDPAFCLTWVPSGTASYQMQKYRQKGMAEWVTTVNIYKPNPGLSAAATGTISGLTTNFIYEFQIDSVCSGGVGHSNIYEQIIFSKQTLGIRVDTTTVNIDQAPMPMITTIDYQLCLSGTPVNTTSATGVNPIAKFVGVTPGTQYTIKYRYAAFVNSVTVYSSDSSYVGVWFESDPFTV